MRLRFLGGPHDGATADPLSAVLTAALRRLGRERPEVFERLGRFRRSPFVVSPRELPFAFRLSPDGERGVVRVVGKADPGPCTASISAPLLTLLALVDGIADADAEFFARGLRVEGDTEAVVALHNTLEAAELSPGDLLGLPAGIKARVDPALRGGLNRLRRLIAPPRPN